MSPIIFWMLGISFSAAATVTAAAFELRGLQFLLSFIMVGFIGLAGFRDQRALQMLGAFPSHQSATMVRHMGLMYGFAAAMIALVYGLLLEWPTWIWAFFVLSLGATLCLFLANILMRDLADAAVDSRIVVLVSTIAKAQFAATCVCFGGLIALGEWSPSTLGGDQSWVAVNVLLATALGLAALSAYVIVFPIGIEPEADAVAAPTVAEPVQERRKAQQTVTVDRRKQKPTFGKLRSA
jgi:hypothetical protein